MARVLGYGGVANTNGARDFSTKVEQVAAGGRIRSPGSKWARISDISLWWIILRLFPQ